MDHTGDMGRTRGCWTSVVLIVGLLPAGCGSVKRRLGDSPEVRPKLAFDPNAPWVFLPVTFAGEQCRFIMDTGCTQTIYDVPFKDWLGRAVLWPQTGTAAAGKSFTYECFHAPRASLGPLKVRKGGLIGVADLAGIGTGLKKKVDGVVVFRFKRGEMVEDIAVGKSDLAHENDGSD